MMTACAPAAETSATVQVNMGIMPWIGYAPWYIADRRGYFRDHGLRVKLTNFQQDGDRNAALLAGRLDVANIDAGRTVQFGDKGHPGVPILLVDSSAGADAVLADRSVSGPGQIVGKEIAYEFNTTSDLLLHHYLMRNDIAGTAVEPVNIPAANAGALLISGKQSVAVTYEPYISEVVRNKRGEGIHVVYSSADAPGLISDFLVANEPWLAEHGAQARALISAWDDAVAYLAQNRADAISIMAEGLGVDAGSLSATLAGVKIYSVKENRDLVGSGDLARQYQAIGETLTSMGQVTRPVTLDSVADFSFLG